ncbi:MAG: 3-deoxy-7-phosphoheptulonate synthase [Lachnospiraceae bacterium]|jgi:3-deoxy-7-phosphoheptulonate synthase|nr:3-deoxy-7-phosphoheptulonate synthase [Lachnospiraceae bacterium]
MIAVLKPNVTKEQIDNLIAWLTGQGVTVHVSEGESYTILGLIGDTSGIDEGLLEGLETIASVKRISEPFKRANRKFHPDDTVVEIGKLQIGGPHFQMMAGPCSVESAEQILAVAESVHKSGAAILRGGAFKPRTSPYDFQGLRADGIEYLLEAKKQFGMPIVTEIMNVNHLEMFAEVDVIQVGARNMQNFELLKELGLLRKPILLKRGLANTIQELLMSAEYIMAGGNDQVILCERGIRTFEHFTRNTLDISAIPVLKEMSHLPVVVDPSHATGMARLVKPMAMAAAAAGAHGLMIEVHNDPTKALCDGAQSLNLEQFADTAAAVAKIRQAVAS